MPKTYAIFSNPLFLDRSPNDYVLQIKDLPFDDRPREKLVSKGPEALSIRELMAVVLNIGTAQESVMEMVSRIVKDYGEKSILSERSAKKLSKEMNIPIGKACQIVAVGELGRRVYDRHQSGFVTVRNAHEAYEYLQDMRHLSKEHLRGLYLNAHNRIIRDEVISIGTVDANMIHPREVFRIAIESNAAAIILAHNHPSGEAAPSAEDISVTKQIADAGQIIGITLLDHIIITKDTFVSIIKS